MTTPWGHQTRALDFVRGKRGSMLAMEMGTGKTKVAIDLICEKGYMRTLVIAPLSVVGSVWPGQVQTHASIPIEVVVLGDAVKAKPPESATDRKCHLMRQGLLKTDTPVIVVVNYDSAYRGSLGKAIMATQWDLVVFDESHRIKAPGGVASRFCSRLSDRAGQVLAMTGTPMPHSPLDIYAQARALDKSIFGTSFTRFKGRYAVMGGFNRMNVVNYRDLNHLHEQLYKFAFRVTADEVLDLPEAMNVYPRCTLGRKAARAYQDMADDLIADIAEGTVTASNALTRLLRLQQITSGYVRTSDGQDILIDDSKAKLLTDILTDIGPEPVVVFCRFRHDLDVIHQAAEKLGLPCSEISGRVKELESWQSRGGILATQIQAGGLGLDLTKARYAIYYSLGFSLGDYLQSIARIHRPGQSRPVEYIHLVAEGTVDETIIGALARKEQIVESILERGLV